MTAPTAISLRVFISYSRAQTDRADALVDSLIARGFEVDIDRRTLPFGEAWQAELADMIRRCDSVVWLISPESVRSTWVNWELDEIARRGKRLVPVMVGDMPRDGLPRQIGEINILPSEGQFDLARDLDILVTTLETDRAWVKQASRLQDRAHEWRTTGHATARLLSSGALDDAERWRDRRPPKAPAPSPDVLELLLASRRAATRRQRWLLATVAGIAVGASTLAGVALWQRQVAVANETRAVTGEARVLTGVADRLTEQGDAVGGMLVALAALPADDGGARAATPEAVQSLYASLVRQQERRVFDAPGVVTMRPSRDGSRIATLSRTNVLTVFETATGRVVTRVAGSTGDVATTAGALAWSADGAYLAAALVESGPDAEASADLPMRVTLWDVAGGREIATPVRHADLVTALAVSADGRLLVSGSSDAARAVVLWDVASGAAPVVVAGSDEPVAFAVSPDGRTLAISARSGMVKLLDVAGRREVKQHRLAGFAPVHLAFGADGTRLIALGDISFVWDWTTDAPPKETGGGGDVTGVALADDLEFVVIGTRNGVASVRAGRDLVPVGRPLQHPGDIKAVALTPDRTRVITASSDGTWRVWAAATGDLERQLTTGTRPRETATLHVLPDGWTLVTMDDRSVRLWDLDHAPVLRGHGSWVEGAVFSPDGTRIATRAADRTVRLWAPSGGPARAVLPQGGQNAAAIAFSGDGRELVTVSRDGAVRRWDGATGRALGEAATGLATWNGLTVLDRAARRLVTANAAEMPAGTAELWDVAGGRRIAALDLAADFAARVRLVRATFIRDGAVLATLTAPADGGDRTAAAPDTSIVLWDAATGANRGKLAIDADPFVDFAVDGTGTRLVTLSKGRTTRVWDTETRMPIAAWPSLGETRGFARLIAICEDRRTVATVEGNRGMLRDAQVAATAVPFGPEAGISAIRFTPDCRTLVAVHDDRTVSPSRHWLRLFDVASGRPGLRLDGHTGRIAGLAMDDGGSRLVTSSHDGTARIWPLLPGGDWRPLRDAARHRVPRCLEPDHGRALGLPAEPPRWCIAGPASEGHRYPATWQPRWPYDTPPWRAWLAVRDAGGTVLPPSPDGP